MTTDQPRNEPRHIRAPWTPEQVTALNAFQQRGGMHPFTCGRDHDGTAYVLIAHPDGWHCSQPPCDYRQVWAHAFMAEPSAWPKPIHHFARSGVDTVPAAPRRVGCCLLWPDCNHPDRYEGQAAAPVPECNEPQGCHRVITCDPGCAVASRELHAKLAAARTTPDNPATSGEAADNLREKIAAAFRERYLSSDRAEADADGNAPCVCGSWRDPGPMGSDEEDWDTHLADVALAAVQGRYVPPPPGSDRDKLPDEILAVIEMAPYLSSACETAAAIEDAGGRIADPVGWAGRMHTSCRLTRKQDLAPCRCLCHQAVAR